MPTQPPLSLLRHMAAGRCVLFIGAGLSAWAQLPDWESLCSNMIEATKAEGDVHNEIAELEIMLRDGQLLEIADHCKERLGQRLYTEVLVDALRGDNVDIPEPHRLITSLPFSMVITTNYDTLLERAYFERTG